MDLDSTPLPDKVEALFHSAFRSELDFQRYQDFTLRAPTTPRILLLFGGSTAGPTGKAIGCLAQAPEQPVRLDLPARDFLLVADGVLVTDGNSPYWETPRGLAQLAGWVDRARRGSLRLVILLSRVNSLLEKLLSRGDFTITALSSECEWQCGGDLLPRVPLSSNEMAVAQLLGQIAADGSLDLFRNSNGGVVCPYYGLRPMRVREFSRWVSARVCLYRGRELKSGRVKRCLMRREAGGVMENSLFLDQLPPLPVPAVVEVTEEFLVRVKPAAPRLVESGVSDV